MSGQSQRLNVFPTVTTLQAMDARLLAAMHGHALLKKKSDALSLRFVKILKKIVSTKQSMEALLKASYLELADAKYVVGDNVKHVIPESVESATLKLRSRYVNVAGVKVPKFDYFTDGETRFNLTGLGRGGLRVQVCRLGYVKAIEVLVKLASLQSSFLSLDEAIKRTKRRANALAYVVTPRLEKTIGYIKKELEEQEREDFFRMKKIQGFKKREIERKQITAAAKEFKEDQFAEKDDEDIIF